MTRLLRTVTALATAAAITLTSAPASAAPHSGPYWTWDGPESWTAAYGAYGITVLGDRRATLDLGFSSILCAPGATWDESAASYFAAARKQLRSTGWDLKAGAVTNPGGFSTTYRRQRLTGTHGRLRGEITLDYDFTTTVDGVGYCYQRSLAKYSRKSAWKSMRKTLRKVQHSLAYFGPGAPEGQDPDDF
jgi:hypothetical protein